MSVDMFFSFFRHHVDLIEEFADILQGMFEDNSNL